MRPAEESPLIIMKFGGTSVATDETRSQVIKRIQNELELGSLPVVVVSAMGRRGDPYATDTLLSLIEDSICNEHELDLLMSAGEVISSVVLAAQLNKEGIAACALTGMDAGILTDAVHGSASIKLIDPSAIKTILYDGVIPVVAGFQGVDETGALHTLGRGGSDTTACALGVALGAERVDIYTDVDGVYTADPRVIPKAAPLERITADELYQMAKHGSRIVHAPAAELASNSGIRMRIRGTFSSSLGTEVVSLETFKPLAVATAVTTVAGITRLHIPLPDETEDPKAHMEMQTRLYRLLADASISIDMFTPLHNCLVFSIPKDMTLRAQEIIALEGLEADARPSLGKVTLVGSGMHGVPGVMARVAECLRDAEIDILQIADSHATISLLVDEKDLISAAQALHRAFEL